MEGSRGSGEDVEVVQTSRGAGGKQVAPWRAQARRRHLPACLAGKKQLAGAGQHSAGPPGGPAGGLGGLRQVSSSLSLFFLFFYLFLFVWRKMSPFLTNMLFLK